MRFFLLILIWLGGTLGKVAQASWGVARGSCAGALVEARFEEILANGKIPRAKVYYPADFRPGESRKLLVYFHGFGSDVEAYEKFVQGKIDTLYAQMGRAQPVVLSFSMGRTMLAGVSEHGLQHPAFTPAADYWIALRKFMAELDFEMSEISFLANSGGAFNSFQMLRHRPSDIPVRRAVFCSFPNFTEEGLGPNPSLSGERDVRGTQMRTQLEPQLSALMSYRHFSQLLPTVALSDGTFPADVEILIQAAEFDAFGYTALNEVFVRAAQSAAFPVQLKILPGQGHADEYDNAHSVQFLEFGAHP